MRISQIVFLIMSVILFSGCSVFAPVKVIPENTYQINSIPTITKHRYKHHSSILVMLPETNPIYNSQQIAYTTTPYQVSYFSKNKWSAVPANMLQQVMVQTLENTHYFHAVILPSSVGHYDLVLNTQLQELIQDFTHNPSVIRMTLRAQLTQSINNRIVGTKVFTVSEIAPQNTPYGGVIAANRAAAEIARDVSTFCIKRK